jgi:hypothetical protein
MKVLPTGDPMFPGIGIQKMLDLIEILLVCALHCYFAPSNNRRFYLSLGECVGVVN